MRKLICLFVFGVFCANCKKVPVVTTRFGKISGAYDLSYKGKEFSAFYGVPYAQPPVGNLRFEEPQPIKPWPGIWKANRMIRCVQIRHAPEPEGGVFAGDEDCLYLNIFVPRTRPQKGDLLDVIVHIHGGAFMFGSGIGYIGPKYLMDKDVLLITFNYRVGILGFLSTEDEALPGNIGMKDQVAALKWINDNIKYFGGNPSSITLTGLSAGGASVHYHYLSPLSRGLFHRGISVSGTALVPWSIQEKPLGKARFIASHFGCPQENTWELVECLKKIQAKKLVEATRLFRPWLFNPFSPLGLVVERTGERPFLPEHPYSMLVKGKIYDVPWIASLSSEEGLYPAADYVIKNNYLDELNNKWVKLAPHVLDYNFTLSNAKKIEVSLRLRDEYFKRKPISKNTYKELIDLMTDRLFSIPSEQAGKLHSYVSKSPVYFCYFNFIGDKMDSLTVHFARRNQNDGVCHGDDMMYIFSNPHKPISKLTDVDEKMQEVLINMWLSYVKTNKPTVPGIRWIPVTKNLSKPLLQLHIKSPNEMYMEDADDIDRHRQFWKNIKFDENENLFPNLKLFDDY